MRSQYLLVALHMFCSVAFSCESAADKMQMANYLGGDPDFKSSTCGDRVCTGAVLAELLEFRSVKVRLRPNTIVCLVEPIKKSRKIYIGVFVFVDHYYPATQFIFFGSGVRVPSSLHRGVKDLQGSEIPDGPSSMVTSRFRWDGATYKQVMAPGGDRPRQ